MINGAACFQIAVDCNHPGGLVDSRIDALTITLIMIAGDYTLLGSFFFS